MSKLFATFLKYCKDYWFTNNKWLRMYTSQQKSRILDQFLDLLNKQITIVPDSVYFARSNEQSKKINKIWPNDNIMYNKQFKAFFTNQKFNKFQFYFFTNFTDSNMVPRYLSSKISQYLIVNTIKKKPILKSNQKRII